LHAGPKFLAYIWQDGSADSLLRVNQPGQYWVKVTDSCGNVISDTMNVTFAPPIPFSVGPDRSKCNNDTLHIQAPAGFLNYSWSPNYNISALNSPQVTINPALDTTYTIMAEKTPGCFAYDTIHISVNHSTPINLGNDKSFCSGDSAVLDAGAGFQQYIWSNGAASQQLTVVQKGSYWVKGTTAQGCSSSDTVNTVVFDNPVPELGNNPILCEGGTRVLKPGNFKSYLWQDGSTGPSFNVTELGRYYVTVTDNNKCIGRDTIYITRFVNPPSTFLPADTSVCSYASVELRPLRPFKSYTWSNGSISPSIIVKQPGLYWLQATDENDCAGKDSIMIALKDCLFGLYVPSAFSPNHDGKNDVFKPLLFGNIIQYRFSIYNRWGQQVFYSTDPTKGWDGSIAANEQNNNVFVWMLVYQLEGENAKTAKGTVTLVR
jgi:gliding motility-associated-like protein